MADTALVGFGRSHRALLPLLVAEGADLLVLDQKERGELDREGQALLEAWDVPYVGGRGYLGALAGVRRIFLTPGMPKGLPEIQAARARGAEVTGEAAWVFERLPETTVTIGITGSAGKTTTTTLVGELLRAEGYQVAVAGNIGRPLSEVLPDPPAYLVAELSSFQLELFKRGPRLGAILNFSPNHVDVHGSLEAYWQAKLRLVETAPTGAPVVVPADDARLVAAVEERGRRAVLFDGALDASDPAAALVGDELRLRRGGDQRTFVTRRALRLEGHHNVRNVLAAALLASLAGADPARFGDVLARFPGVPHRLERVGEVRGVLYVNDSIATAPDRTVAALRALRGPLILLCGGYDKGLDYEALRTELSGVKTMVTMGPTAPKLEAVARAAGVPWLRVPDLAAAVEVAAKIALPGDTVLLSPASASYDQFANFEVRGERFRSLVEELAQAP